MKIEKIKEIGSKVPKIVTQYSMGLCTAVVVAMRGEEVV